MRYIRKRPRESSQASHVRRAILVAIGLAGLAFTFSFASADAGPPPRDEVKAITIPPATGHYRVGTTVTALTDRSRREPLIRAHRPRSFVVQLWYPTSRRHGRTAAYVSPPVARLIGAGIPGATRALRRVRTGAFLGAPALRHGGGWPVVIFSPGYGMERQLYTGLTEDLASHGFVVVAVDHPEDANVVRFPDGRVVVRAKVAETQATIRRALATCEADVGYLLDQLESRPAIARRGPTRSDLDLSEIGMFGHSLGGATAANEMLDDPRIVAGADLDGTIYGAASHSSLSRPFMILAGAPGPLREKGMRGFFEHLRGPRFAVTFAKARHFAFSDLPFILPPLVGDDPKLRRALSELIGHAPPATMLSWQRRYLAAFFGRYLDGRREPLLSMGPTGSEI